MFTHFAKYIKKFSEKIKSLSESKILLTTETRNTFEKLKSDVENTVLFAIDYDTPNRICRIKSCSEKAFTDLKINKKVINKSKIQEISLFLTAKVNLYILDIIKEHENLQLCRI